MMLTLKKYANGRLYDASNKQYVTKNQLSKLIKEKEKIRIVLAKTGKDVTKSVVSSLPAAKKAETNGKNTSLFDTASIKKRVDGQVKWVTKQIDKNMDAILEMMNFPNQQQVKKLNADVGKLAKKVEALQKSYAQTHQKMMREHKKEMEALAQQYDQRLRMANTAPARESA
jgi:polyhydroxyalkanoate synthesis regulator protein